MSKKEKLEKFLFVFGFFIVLGVFIFMFIHIGMISFSDGTIKFNLEPPGYDSGIGSALYNPQGNLESQQDDTKKITNIVLNFIFYNGSPAVGEVFLNNRSIGNTINGRATISYDSESGNDTNQNSVEFRGLLMSLYPYTITKNIGSYYQLTLSGREHKIEISKDDIKNTINPPGNLPVNFLNLPEILLYEKARVEQKPPPNKNRVMPPGGFNFIINSSVPENIYAGKKTYATAKIQNSGNNDIFIYAADVQPGWEVIDVPLEIAGIRLRAGDTADLGMLDFDAPQNKGDYTYKICLNIEAFIHQPDNKNIPYDWYDYGRRCSQWFDMSVKPIPDDQDANNTGNIRYNFIYNSEDYFWTFNNLTDNKSNEFYGVLNQITEKYPGYFEGAGSDNDGDYGTVTYNVYQVCEAFDWIRDRIRYIEPEDMGYMKYRGVDATLQVQKGCDADIAILMCSIISDLGGSSKIYIAGNHTFSAFYAGSDENTRDIIKSISAFYGADMEVNYFTDRGGNWIVLDPVCSDRVGGLPCGARYTTGGWRLNDVDIIAVDIVPGYSSVKTIIWNDA